MKAPLDKLLPFLQKEAALARQDRAAVELNTHSMRMRIVEAAKKGLTGIRVTMPNTLDVKGTPAASDLERWCKLEGLTLIWQRRIVVLEDGCQSEVWEPEISWAPKITDTGRPPGG